MENKIKELESVPTKKIIFLVFGIIVIAIIALIVFSARKDKENTPEILSGADEETGEAAVPDATIDVSGKEFAEVEVAGLEGAKVVVPGANPITKDNKVVTKEGVVTDSAAAVAAKNAPRQTDPLDVKTLPKNIVNLEVGNGKFSPNEFTTTAGAPTTFSLTSVDEYTHLISFDNPAVSAVIILVGPGQTKAITFNAPVAGTYSFRCAVPGHAEDGEVGQMIVK